MSDYSKDDALLELEKYRERLLSGVNTAIDALAAQLENDDAGIDGELPDEIVYPLTVTPSLFKGRKPTAVFFGDERVSVKTWRAAYTEILRRCVAEPDKHAALMELRNRIHVRTRTILSDKPDGMNVPIKLADDLFIEADFDTEWLVRTLTTEILDAVKYDYNNISFAVISGRRRR